MPFVASLAIGDHDLRVAVIGLGGVAERIHLPACRSIAGLEVVAGAEPDDERRRCVGERFSIPATYPTAGEMLAAARPDLVIVGTPPDTHCDLAVAALEHGAHVLCEKPFASTVEEADRMIDAADARGLGLRVNTQYRFMRIYRETQQRIGAGEFGEPYFLQCWQQMYHPPVFETNWRSQLRRSTLFEFGTHALDLIAFLFADLPDEISAHAGDAGQGFDADVLVQATLRFPRGRLATVAFNRVSHAAERYLEMRLDCEKASLRLSLGGVARASIEWSRKRRMPALRWNLVRGGVARAERAGTSRVIASEPRPAFTPATAALLGDFVEQLRAGTAANEEAYFSREILATALAGYESAESGQWVRLRRRER
jgi:predicted dehydrogenase